MKHVHHRTLHLRQDGKLRKLSHTSGATGINVVSFSSEFAVLMSFNQAMFGVFTLT